MILDYHKFVSANVGKIGFLYMNAFVGGGVGYILEMWFEIIVNLCFCIGLDFSIGGDFLFLFFYNFYRLFYFYLSDFGMCFVVGEVKFE